MASPTLAEEKVPRLAPAGSGGLPYASWRPAFITYAMKNGVERRDYQEPYEGFEQLVAVVEANG